MNSESPKSQTTPDGVAPSPFHVKAILVPLDFSEMSLKSLQYAVPLAKQFGATLTLLHVLKAPAGALDSGYLASLGHQQLTVIERRLEEMIPSDVALETTVRQNFVTKGILEVAREISADLIILTMRDDFGVKDLLMRSTAETVVREAPCPVLVLHEGERDLVEATSP
jgi:universal stress protein A